jgi:hypothetical protein
MILPVERGERRVHVVFTRTLDRTLGSLLSLGGLLGSACLLWLGRERGQAWPSEF